MTLTLYGIPNCDTVKKARTWLAAAGIAHDFHDYKKAGVDAGLLGQWVAAKGWEVILNRAGTTFRALPEADRAAIDAAKAIRLMLAAPSMIKRPILVDDTARDLLLVGFKPDLYQAALA